MNKLVKMKQRKINKYNEIRKIIIFCEGEKTEPNYFNEFKRLIEKNAIYSKSIKVEIEKDGNVNCRLVKSGYNYINNRRINNADIWFVYDKDDFLDADFDCCIKLIKEYNKECKKRELKYNLAWSNQCIEFWFLLHFSFYHSDNDRKFYIKSLKEFIDYNKNDSYIFNKLIEKGNPKEAIKYAERIRQSHNRIPPSKCSPGTMVHKLVEALVKYLPEEKRKFFI